MTPDRDAAATQRRGRFDGLQLGSGKSAETAKPFTEVLLDVADSVPVRTAAQRMQDSLERFARAWTAMGRMNGKGLPVLAHQRTEFDHAADGLDRLRPGASRDVMSALVYEAGSLKAMRTLEGPARAAQLLAGIEHEERIRRDPNLRV